jgi:hypothetical protein
VEGTGDSFSLLFWGEEFTSSTPKLTISTKNEAFSCGFLTIEKASRADRLRNLLNQPRLVSDVLTSNVS